MDYASAIEIKYGFMAVAKAIEALAKEHARANDLEAERQAEKDRAINDRYMLGPL